MGIARSTVYDRLPVETDDTALVEAISEITGEFEAYGWRRVRAALRRKGIVANHKKIWRLMPEHDLQPRMRRRHVVTTDSGHDGPIFPNLARDFELGEPDQLWLVDIAYVAVRGGFAYVAIVLGAGSRRVIGYAIGRSIDVRLTLGALRAALECRRAPPGCIDHGNRGSLYAAGKHRELLTETGLVGSMGRRGNPYHNARAESFMRTLKVEGVYSMADETFEHVATELPRFI